MLEYVICAHVGSVYDPVVLGLRDSDRYVLRNGLAMTRRQTSTFRESYLRALMRDRHAVL